MPHRATPRAPDLRAIRRIRTRTAYRLADEFVPLMPMTEQELTGPFQLVRVQMPNARRWVALRSPLEHPNELVEADVLAGRRRNGARHSRLDQRICISLEVPMIH